MSWVSPRTWATDEIVTAAQLNEQLRDNLTHLYNRTVPIAILQDVKAQNTGGGSSIAGWNARDLNTEIYDPDNIVTIASNRFTPIAGNYMGILHTTSGDNVGEVMVRLFNFTAPGVVGIPASTNFYSNISLKAIVSAVSYFTANGTDSFRLEMFTRSAVATSGLGIAMNLTGSSERYSQVTLIKVS